MEKTEELNILISSAGRQLPLVKAFVKAIDGSGKIIVADSNPYVSSGTAADLSIVSPKFSTQEYKNWCLDVCMKYGVGLWISLHEEELVELEDLRQQMNELDCLLIGAPTEHLRHTMDKYSYPSFLKEFNILVPKTWILKDLNSELSLPPGKYIIKMRKGRGSKGIIRVENTQELLNIAKEKKYSEDWVAQEVIEGEVYCVDVINDLNRDFSSCLVRKRLVMGGQETDVAETVINDDINQIAQRLSKAIMHQGCADVDIIKKDEKYYVIDINVRFGGSHIFSMAAGANIPAAIIAWRTGKNVNSDWLRHDTGNIFTRYSNVVPYTKNYSNC
ncbi:ATP-grasp domain-containing protein [Aliifodinibius sp. S!AR15-10]|uniref:ATP-grasp domain-containing protein n=1 Tax=Aliifodinibius sp. S!AR15-10 TaxID=2950437 RepID=UPI00285853C0|nr:ATP-grasp domain-containing protein [Aliifodinibius sp. S!AR15-10]MDR8393496.1 ATP-grasp domain-containing protein [Aliifodinibius sp. S!AR15-10]